MNKQAEKRGSTLSTADGIEGGETQENLNFHSNYNNNQTQSQQNATDYVDESTKLLDSRLRPNESMCSLAESI